MAGGPARAVRRGSVCAGERSSPGSTLERLPLSGPRPPASVTGGRSFGTQVPAHRSLFSRPLTWVSVPCNAPWRSVCREDLWSHSPGAAILLWTGVLYTFSAEQPVARTLFKLDRLGLPQFLLVLGFLMWDPLIHLTIGPPFHSPPWQGSRPGPLRSSSQCPAPSEGAGGCEGGT